MQKIQNVFMDKCKFVISKAEHSFSSVFSSPLYFFMKRTKSASELDGSEVNGAANQEEKIQFAIPPLLVCPELGDLSKKNWTYLTNEVNNLYFYTMTGLKCAVSL